MAHANARLTFHSRCLLVSRVVEQGRPVAHVAKELGVSRQCAHRWLARYRSEGMVGLTDRSSRANTVANRTPSSVEAGVVAARLELRLGRDRVSAATGVPARTVSRILARHGLPPVGDLDPVTGTPVRASKATGLRYERPEPGDLLHIDVKKIGRIPPGGGWRVHGRGQRPGKKRGLGFDYVHAAVDDHSRLAYAEVLPDEKGATCAGFLLRAAEFYARHGITIREVISDNAKNYLLARVFHDAIEQLGAKQRFIKPHCPWQNGKVERFNRTLALEWAYRQPFDDNDERAAALGPWLNYYNNERTHHGIGDVPPINRTRH